MTRFVALFGVIAAVVSYLVGVPLGFVLAVCIFLDAANLEEWNGKKERRLKQNESVEQELLLTPMHLQVIAETARQVESSEATTLFKFLASCKKVSYEALKSLMLVDVDPKLLKQKMEGGNVELFQVRRDFLRNIAKKLTHPLFGITPSDLTEDKYRGFEIVEWLAANFGLQRTHATELGQAMQVANMILPLKRLKSAPGKRVAFGDKMRHWKFDYAAIDKDWPAQREKQRNQRRKILAPSAGIMTQNVKRRVLTCLFE
jgi:hypothetical protein